MSNQSAKLYLYVEHPELKTAYESKVEKHNINAKEFSIVVLIYLILMISYLIIILMVIKLI